MGPPCCAAELRQLNTATLRIDIVRERPRRHIIVWRSAIPVLGSAHVGKLRLGSGQGRGEPAEAWRVVRVRAGGLP